MKKDAPMKNIRMASLHACVVLLLTVVLLPCFALGGSIFKTWGDISLSYPDNGWVQLTEASIRNFQSRGDDKKVLIALNSAANSEVGADAIFRLTISWDYQDLSQKILTEHREELDGILPDTYRQTWLETDKKLNSTGRMPRQTSRLIEACVIDFKGRKALMSHRAIHFDSGKVKESFLLTIPLAPYAIIINYNWNQGNAHLQKDVEGILNSIEF